MDRIQRKNANQWSGLVVLKLLGNCLLMALSIFFIYNVVKSVQIMQIKLDILQTAREEVDQLRLKNLLKLQEEERAQTDEYIYAQARDRLNLSKEGENIFVIPAELLDQSYLETKLNIARNGNNTIVGQEGKSSVLEVWLEFFKNGV